MQNEDTLFMITTIILLFILVLYKGKQNEKINWTSSLNGYNVYDEWL